MRSISELCGCVFLGDCLIELEDFPESSIDLVLADLPYGRTQNAWDQPLDLKLLWKGLYRISKPQTAFVFTAIQPFASELIMSNRAAFRYDLIWRKNKSTGFLNANRAPLRAHEHVLVFCRQKPPYYPQKTKGHPPVHSYTKHTSDGSNYGRTKLGVSGGGSTERYPNSILDIPVVNNTGKLHPTQKPTALFEYLIRTYTRPDDIVLDPCAGSGTTGVAAQACGRRFVLMDSDREMVGVARKRLTPKT